MSNPFSDDPSVAPSDRRGAGWLAPGDHVNCAYCGWPTPVRAIRDELCPACRDLIGETP